MFSVFITHNSMVFSKITLHGGTHCQTLAATFDHLSLFFSSPGCVSSSSFFSFSFHTRWLLLLPSDLGFFFSFSFLTGFSDTGKKKKAAPSDRYGAHKQCEKYWVMRNEWWHQTSRVFKVMSDEWWVMEIEWWKKVIQTPP